MTNGHQDGTRKRGTGKRILERKSTGKGEYLDGSTNQPWRMGTSMEECCITRLQHSYGNEFWIFAIRQVPPPPVISRGGCSMCKGEPLYKIHFIPRPNRFFIMASRFLDRGVGVWSSPTFELSATSALSTTTTTTPPPPPPSLASATAPTSPPALAFPASADSAAISAASAERRSRLRRRRSRLYPIWGKQFVWEIGEGAA